MSFEINEESGFILELRFANHLVFTNVFFTSKENRASREKKITI